MRKVDYSVVAPNMFVCTFIFVAFVSILGVFNKLDDSKKPNQPHQTNIIPVLNYEII